jgi:two-component system C4-dicarboxylate transport sensor histidine kinase DctB
MKRALVWLSGLWLVPVWIVLILVFQPSARTDAFFALLGFVLSPLPALLFFGRREAQLRAESEARREEVEQLRLQLDAVRHRTSQLRAELSAADRQARLSHQLTTLGRFTAGFLHEFNNPLAILTNRIEILLEERRDDVALCADLQQMLKEARYMGRIAGTLLPALRRERGEEVFEASVPVEVLQDAVAAMGPSAEREGVRIGLETSEVPPVNLPGHVVSEVVRGLLANALAAVRGREDGTVWLRLEPYRTAGSRVVLRVEDNGPGVPESIRDHLFEPFISPSPGRERLGLGLFLAASLLDTYDGSLRYETRNGGGASFVVEMPTARFTRGQPYHWFVKGVVS